MHFDTFLPLPFGLGVCDCQSLVFLYQGGCRLTRYFHEKPKKKSHDTSMPTSGTKIRRRNQHHIRDEKKGPGQRRPRRKKKTKTAESLLNVKLLFRQKNTSEMLHQNTSEEQLRVQHNRYFLHPAPNCIKRHSHFACFRTYFHFFAHVFPFSHIFYHRQYNARAVF